MKNTMSYRICLSKPAYMAANIILDVASLS